MTSNEEMKFTYTNSESREARQVLKSMLEDGGVRTFHSGLLTSLGYYTREWSSSSSVLLSLAVCFHRLDPQWPKACAWARFRCSRIGDTTWRTETTTATGAGVLFAALPRLQVNDRQ